jgi:hypothetical protein
MTSIGRKDRFRRNRSIVENPGGNRVQKLIARESFQPGFRRDTLRHASKPSRINEATSGIQSSRTSLRLYALRVHQPRRKNPPRIAADGFCAKQFTLNKTPWLTGPVKRCSIFLSTGLEFITAREFEPD